MTLELLESDILLETAAYELEVQRDINYNLITVILESGETNEQEVSRFKKWWEKICKFFKMLVTKIREWWRAAVKFVKAKLSKRPKPVKREEMKDEDIPHCSDAELKVIRVFLAQRLDGEKSFYEAVNEITDTVNKISITSIKKGISIKAYKEEDFLSGKENFGEVKRIYTKFKKSISKYDVEYDVYEEYMDVTYENDTAFGTLNKAFADMQDRIGSEIKQYNVKSSNRLDDISKHIDTLRVVINGLAKFGTENFKMTQKLIDIIY